MPRTKSSVRGTDRPEPPRGLPVYRILTGPDDAAFCRRVSEALAIGYCLYGSPAATFDGEHVVVAQALVWPSVLAATSAPAPGRTRAVG